MSVRFDCGACVVRSWEMRDLPSLVRYADNRNVWLGLRDRFPHPYTEADGRAFLALIPSSELETNFAIDVAGEAVGGIGLVLGRDVERCSAELGYWLGQPFWGRGIATAAVRRVTEHAFGQFRLTRVFAIPFVRNAASCRVLEKAGFEREGILRRSAIKDGVLLDQAMYSRVL